MDRNWLIVLPLTLGSLLIGAWQGWKAPHQNSLLPPTQAQVGQPAVPIKAAAPAAVKPAQVKAATPAKLKPAAPVRFEGEPYAWEKINRFLKQLVQERQQQTDQAKSRLEQSDRAYGDAESARRWLQRRAEDLEDQIRQLQWQVEYRDNEMTRFKQASAAAAAAVPAPPAQQTNQGAESYYKQGLAYSMEKNSEEAIFQYNQAISVDPAFAPAWLNLGMEYLQSSQYSQAQYSFSRAVLLTPADPVLHYNLGLLAERVSRNPDEALYHYERFLALAPKDPDAPHVRKWIKQIAADAE